MLSRLSAPRKVLLALVSLLVVVLVATAVTAVVVVRRSFPTTSGAVTIDGLVGPVTVERDARGVPYITATTSADLFRAQGYVHAQDRFFEMDYRRHVTSGRLSELVGDNPDAISADRVIRAFGWRRVAEREWDLLDQDTRDNLTAYAEGVNAYLTDRSPSELALEYAVLGVQVNVSDPEPWQPIDSVAWLKAMAWDLRGNFDEELERAAAYGTLRDVDLVESLFPAYPDAANPPILDADEAATTRDERRAAAAAVEGGTGGANSADDGLPLEDAGVRAALDATADALAAVPHQVGRGEGTGSNSWVVSGDLAESGKPLLANDPHLSLAAPSIWAQVGLRCAQVSDACPYDVAGFSFSGLPGVIIGHNADLAWGLTNLGADVTDFFVEAIRDDSYLRDGAWQPLTVRQETIKVNGGDDIVIDVAETIHGPIISGEYGEALASMFSPLADAGVGGVTYGVALGWTALTPNRTADAIFALNRAATADDVAAAAALFAVPSQNIVFATTDGHIGYQAPGAIPLRGQVAGPVPSDGTWPRPGWDPAYDWQGLVDPADMPAVLDPASGVVVAANQAVLPAGKGPYLTSDWDYGYRSQRIGTLLGTATARNQKLSAETMSAIQSDVWSPFAAALVPTLLSIKLDDAFAAQGQELLRDWDYNTDPSSPAAAYFNAVWAQIVDGAFADDLPDSVRPSGSSRWLAVVTELLDDPEARLWDDRTTVDVVETRDEILRQALVDARLELTTALGRDTGEWQWGRLHQLRLEHPVLGGESIPWPVRAFVNPGAVQLGGGSSIVDATGWDASERTSSGRTDFQVTSGPSMRMVVDLAALDSSTWVVVTGTSGHPGHPHYSDQLEAWSIGETFAWPFTPDAVTRSAGDTLRLVPSDE
ncbi:penicillin acylase family protein [Sanguibacter sp. HDW7]|uniref:penicillin acylase family protein n=1 Tax=Sanguibacter sp. HDW7 TaxID=2714931 RepID=UPI00140B1E0F|nr:penicillin acylase family protein [Sanguibacter sp. HDW7]QIK84250.1 penicillin acylase family protein [Sanguibacter sp. HDW7]